MNSEAVSHCLIVLGFSIYPLEVFMIASFFLSFHCKLGIWFPEVGV